MLTCALVHKIILEVLNVKKKSLFLSIIVVVVLAFAPIINAAEDVDVSSSHYGNYNWHYITTSNSITSPYGPRGSGFHYGFDIGVMLEPAYAMSAGVVRLAGWSNTAGNWVVITSNDTDTNGNEFTARYLHLDGYVVWTGKSVVRGEYLGDTGNTGDSTGYHLHFDVNNGLFINGSDLTQSNTIDPVLFWPNRNFTYPSPLSSGESANADLDLSTAIPDYLIDYVGQTTFQDWVDSTPKEDAVLVNFLNFDIDPEDMDDIRDDFFEKMNNQ